MLAFATLASREFSGRAFRWLPMLVLIGTLGFWDRAHARDPVLFDAWWSSETLANYIGLVPGAASMDLTYHLRNLPWFAWPSLPLLLWTLWTRGRGFNGGLREPGVVVPAILSAVMLVN